MTKFDKSKIEELKEFLYHIDSHDAEIMNSKYDVKNGIYCINLYNPIVKSTMHFVFYDVKIAMFFKDYNHELLFGDNEKIYSLSVEEDSSLFKNNPNLSNDYYDDTLYLLFEMFSGDALHIVSKEVLVDIQRNKNSAD